MTLPIAIQLYTVRDLLPEDFDGIIGRIAEIGYAGVETFGDLSPTPARKAVQHFGELGLTVCSAHLNLPLGDKQRKMLDLMATYGCRQLVAGPGPADVRSADRVKQTCDRMNEANRVAMAHDLQLVLHNHWWEFETVEGLEEGPYPYQTFLARLSPDIGFELDTYWIQSAGHDPAAIVAEFGARAPLLHIKDGPATADTGAPMVAVGQGTLDFPDIIEAGAGHIDWLIVELDHCATDMMTAVENSFNYLVKEELGHGQ